MENGNKKNEVEPGENVHKIGQHDLTRRCLPRGLKHPEETMEKTSLLKAVCGNFGPRGCVCKWKQQDLVGYHLLFGMEQK